MTRTVCTFVLSLLLLAALAAMAHAEEDYTGTFHCSSTVSTDCDKCLDWAPPYATTLQVIDRGGGMYRFCVDDGVETDCHDTRIEDGGRVYFTETEAGFGTSYTSTTQAQYAKGKWKGSERGGISGMCSCSFSSDSVCTR